MKGSIKASIEYQLGYKDGLIEGQKEGLRIATEMAQNCACPTPVVIHCPNYGECQFTREETKDEPIERTE